MLSMWRGVWELVWEGGSAWNVHRHCQWSAAKTQRRGSFFSFFPPSFFFFIFVQRCLFWCHKPPEHGRSPLQKQTKEQGRRKRERESPQSPTVQFQRREYFMKMKHPKVTGIIKAYKSLKRLRLLCFILPARTSTHASTINCYSHR